MKTSLRLFLPFLLLPSFLAASDFEKYMSLSSKTKVQQDKIKHVSKAIESWDSEDGEENLAAAYFSRAAAYTFLGEYEKSLSDYDKSIELRGADYRLFINRASVYTGLKRYDDAISDYSSAKSSLSSLGIKDAVVKAMIPKGLCQVYCMKAEYEKAVEKCREAISINPRYDQAYAQLGMIYIRKKEYLKAREHLYKSIEKAELNKEKHVAKYNIKKSCYHIAPHHEFIGWSYYLQNKTVSAEKEFRKAISCSVDEWGAYLGMALLSDKKNEMDKMGEYFEKALKLNPRIKDEAYFAGNAQFPIATPSLEKDIRQVVNLYYYSK